MRTHYLIYWSIKALLDGRDLSALNDNDALHMRLFLPASFLRANSVFGISDNEFVLMTHVLNGLARHNLLHSSWWGGDEAIVKANEPNISESGYFVTPTGFGVELFLWAHGHNAIEIADFLSPELKLQQIPDLLVQGLPRSSPDLSVDRARQQAEEARRRQEAYAFQQRVIAARRGL